MYSKVFLIACTNYKPNKLGTFAVNALLTPAYAEYAAKKKAPKVSSQSEAIALLGTLLETGFFMKAQRPAGSDASSKFLSPDFNSTTFTEDALYAWVYEGSQLMTLVGALGLIFAVFGVLMYPFWPGILKDGMWYLLMAGVGFIVFLLVLAVVRLMLFVVTVVAVKPGIWLFPNLFEDVGFFESFVPLYAWHLPEVKREKRRENDNK